MEAFGTLVRSLGDEEWAAPSRCEGWTVADVAAHVISTVTDITEGRLEGLGSPEVTARQVEERRGRRPVELAEEVDRGRKGAADLLAAFPEEAWSQPSPGGFDFSLRDGVEAIWYDTYVHGDDVREAIGRPSVGGPGLRASVHHVALLLGRRLGPGDAGPRRPGRDRPG